VRRGDAAFGIRDVDGRFQLVTLNVTARDADEHIAHGNLRDLLGLAHGNANRINGFVQIDDDTAAQALARARRHAEHSHMTARIDLTDDGANLCRADVDAGEHHLALGQLETNARSRAGDLAFALR